MKWCLTTLALLLSLSIYSQSNGTDCFFSETELNELLVLHSDTIGVKLARDSTSAELLWERANNLMTKGDFILAIELYKMGHDICKKLNIKTRLPVFQNDLGFAFETTHQYIKATLFYSKSIKSSDSLRVQRVGPDAYSNLAAFWADKGASFDSLQTTEFLQTMLGEFEEMIVLARVFYRLAARLYYQKKYEHAIQFFDAAINIQIAEQDTLWLMRSYNNKAHTLVAAGRYYEAKDCYVKGMITMKLLQPEPIPDWEVAQGYHNLAHAFRSIGDYTNALFFLEQAKAIWEISNDQDQLLHVLEDRRYIYIEMGDAERASIDFDQLQASKKGEILNEDKTRGVLKAIAGDLDSALYFLKKHVELHKDKEEPFELAIAYNDIGHIYMLKQQYQKAKKYLRKALDLAKEFELPIVQANSLNNLGILYSKLDKLLKAADYFMDAIAIYNQIGSEIESMKAMMSLSNIVLQAGQVEFSLDVALRNIELIDVLRETYKGHEDRLLLQQKSKNIIDGAVFSAFLLGKDSLVYSFCQRTKNRLLADLLAEQSISSKNLSVELVESQEIIDEHLKRKRLEISNSVDLNTRKQLIAERDSLYKHKTMLKDRMRILAPDYTNLLYPKPVDYQEVQKVLNPDEVIVEYYFGILKVYALVVTKDSFRVMDLEESEVVKQFIQAFREDFIEHQKTALLNGDIFANIRLRHDFYRVSSQLYQSIWKPLEEAGLFNGKKEVIVIPDDALVYLPFELLVENDKMVEDYRAYDYLVKKYGISYYPSSITLHYERTKVEEKKQWTSTFLGLAVQDFHNNDCIEGMSSISDLEYSISEVNDIAKIFPGSHKVVVGSAARKSFLESHALTNYRYLHFSSHSLIDTEYPQYSRILLDASEGDEACINLYEIFDLDLDADIISLSSCNSRLGKMVVGEGMISFTRALMYAGTPTVILSQWNVFDEASSILFVKYYSKLNSTSGNNKYKPLRAVQLEMINSKTYANPYFWSSFVFVGKKQHEELITA